MALHYLDASAVVCALVREPAANRVRAWLGVQDPGALAISPWVATEVASALSMKIRTGDLSLQQRAEALSEWQFFRDESLIELSIERDTFEKAADFVGRAELSLRAGDALHLAICAANACSLVTLDERMAKAALELGVAVTEI
ncbi:MAG: type II toxin-antitoxin system VapC family toxin [Candidatus Andeanibacterium colombiense]|uniref:Ribonuclease VapC n=1 Tax=Candidatus Andeanibacterium colombiense TaxID=3121345 RepID=A0AAJ6BMX5_9SPHN|nr:MAG: type II toxin-antitoxin system VapC family toxin [Sphingomonadaceae bacterium]